MQARLERERSAVAVLRRMLSQFPATRKDMREVCSLPRDM